MTDGTAIGRARRRRVAPTALSLLHAGCLVLIVFAATRTAAPARFEEADVAVTDTVPREPFARATESLEDAAPASREALAARLARDVEDEADRPAERSRPRDLRSLHESEHRAAWRARLAADPAGALSTARAALLGDGPDAERVGLLRAAVDVAGPEAVDLLAMAIRDLPDASRAEATSVPRRALELLGALAARDARALAALEDLAFDPAMLGRSELRRLVGARAAALLPVAEAGRIEARLAVEADPEVAQAIRAALAGVPHDDAALGRCVTAQAGTAAPGTETGIE